MLDKFPKKKAKNFINVKISILINYLFDITPGEFIKKAIRWCLFAFIAFLAIYASFRILPNKATIYFEGSAREASFKGIYSTNINITYYTDENYSLVKFFSNEEGDPYIKIVDNNYAYNSLLNDFDGISSFSFIENAILFNNNGYLTINCRLDDFKEFTYDMSIDREIFDGNILVNKVTIYNFNQNLKIYLSGNDTIYIKDSIDAKLNANKYSVLGCSKIEFYMLDSDELGENNFHLKNKINFDNSVNANIDFFKFYNYDKSILEFTQTSNTINKELGHVIIDGQSYNDKLRLEIDDLGAYPLPIILSGQVNTLNVEEETYFIIFRNWITDNMTTILTSLFAAIFTFILTKKEK